MRVEPSVSADDEVLLRFRLRYDGNDRIDVETSSIPGAQRRNTISVSATRYPDYDGSENKTCGSLDDIISIDDPGPGWKSAKPGDAWVENIKLSDLISGIKDVIGHCELVVSWTYKMYTRDKIRFPRMAGSVVIPLNRRIIVPPEIRVIGDAWKYKRVVIGPDHQ